MSRGSRVSSARVRALVGRGFAFDEKVEHALGRKVLGREVRAADVGDLILRLFAAAALLLRHHLKVPERP